MTLFTASLGVVVKGKKKKKKKKDKKKKAKKGLKYPLKNQSCCPAPKALKRMLKASRWIH